MNQVTFRKTVGRTLFLVSILALAAGTSSVLGAEEITGNWEITMDFNGRQSFATLSISRNADGTLAGKWGASELTDVKFEDTKLTFVRTIKVQDREFKMTYEGTLKDGRLTGKISGERGEFSANGARIKPRPTILGQWDLSYKIGDRDVSAKLAISQKPDGALDGRWTSEFGESVVSNVKFQDGILSLSRKTKLPGGEFESTFEGSVTGHKLAGTIKSDRGEVAVSGQRVGAALVGKWELTSTSERGPRTRTLTVYGDMTGRYEMFGGEIPIKDLKLEGDQVSFKVAMGFGDQTFEMEFKGKLDGKTLKGQMVTPNGTNEVAGKKIETASALVGTWELTSESPQGVRTSTLKIKEDMTGTYTTRDSETPITDLKVEGEEVAFKVMRKFGEREVPMEFKGRLDGTTLKGQFITTRGSREVTGKKIG
jgi:hypothetical protein